MSVSYEQLLFNAIKNGQQTVKSVYDIWLEAGNTGSPEDFINSLKADNSVKDLKLGFDNATNTLSLLYGDQTLSSVVLPSLPPAEEVIL